MLNPQEKYAFDNMVTKLRSDDPAFVSRIDKLGRPRQRLLLALAVLLWMSAPVCIYYGGWTGLLFAVVGAAYGAYLVFMPTGRR